ncbi:MAG: chemotaxis protein CheW [bacterium]|nr:chemotaxis protein CheW [bacterium]MDT8396016.1 chemotaxis protein CheW [bacterium]
MTDPVILESNSEEKSRHPEHEVVMCTVGKEYFALPLEAMAEIYKAADITPLPLSPAFMTGVINVHGNLASVLSLAGLLGLSETPGVDGLLLILTAEYGGFALLIDSTTGFTAYTTLEEVARDNVEDDSSVAFIEGVFRDKGKLVSLINPGKLRVWIDSEFTKGDN